MRKPLALVVLAVWAVAGCAGPPPLTATLTGRTEIRLDWRAAPAGALGQLVEYANSPDGPFTALAFLPPTATSYRHPKLIPHTAFYYRVRAFTGHWTAPIPATVTGGVTGTGTAPADPNWAAPHLASGAADGAGGGAPTDLRAVPVGPDGVRLTWVDHALDADAYLVQVTPAGGAPRVAAVLRPHTDGVGVFPLPDERTAAYRVAAVRYDPPTPVVRQTTGDP